MSETKISNRYAHALMQQANTDNKLSAVAADMSVISATCKNSKDLRNALKNPIINPIQKQNAILSIFSKTDKTTQDFLKLVCQRNRENFLPDIAEAFLTLYRKAQGIEKVLVQSAAPISESDKKSIEAYVQKHTGAKAIEMHTEIQASVIGGLVIKFGDNLLDTSVSAKLRKLKKELNIA
jgi:F-type H+-transporting ATPase subunit delta